MTINIHDLRTQTNKPRIEENIKKKMEDQGNEVYKVVWNILTH